jgi:lipoprotein
MDKTKIVVTAIIGVVVVIGAWFIASGFKNFREGQPVISVTGMAEKEITSDLIVWKITVNAEGSTRSSAFTEFEKSARVMSKYLQTHGIPEKEITLSSVDISKRTKDFWDEDSRKYVTLEDGYSVSQTFTVSSNELKRVEGVYQRISELYNSGMDFSSEKPLYYYTKLNDLKMEMLNQASANAYERAQTIAKGSDSKVGSVVSSTMGVFQIVGLNSDEEYSWGGTFNTSSKEKVASITVKTTYRVK